MLYHSLSRESGIGVFPTVATAGAGLRDLSERSVTGSALYDGATWEEWGQSCVIVLLPG
jgi:hypothetical protein